MSGIKNGTEHNKWNPGPLFIATAAFLWTTDAVARGFLSQEISSGMLVLFEHTIIVIAISPVLKKYWNDLTQMTKEEWGALLFVAIGGSSLATISLTQAYSLENGAYITIVALLQQSQPIIAVGLAHWLLRERLPKYYYPLAFGAIVGVFLMFFPFLTNFTNNPTKIIETLQNYDKQALLAGLLGLLAAFFWGGSTTFGRYMLEHGKHKFEYFQMTAYRFSVALLFLIIYNLVIGQFVTPRFTQITQFTAIGALLYIALVPGLLSLVLYYYGLKTTHASVSAIFELAFPLSALVLLPLVFKDQIVDQIQILGAIILIVSTTILSYSYRQTSPQ